MYKISLLVIIFSFTFGCSGDLRANAGRGEPCAVPKGFGPKKGSNCAYGLVCNPSTKRCTRDKKFHKVRR